MKQANVFKIPDALADKYHGCGYVFAAVTGGQITDLVYLNSVIPDLDESNREFLIRALAVYLNPATPRRDEIELTETPAAIAIGTTINYLSSLGEVFVGMCSCWEFVEV